MLPLTALASIQPAFADDTGSVTITVAAVDNNTNKFIFTPTEISVPSGKALEYGYSNAAPGTMVGGVDHGLPADAVSPLDALIAAHELQYGVGFTPGSYLGGTSSNLTKMFGLSSYGVTYSVDGLPPVGTFSDGYGINEWALEDGDLVVFTNASDENWGIDSASFFVEQSITTTVDQPFTLTLIGYDPMEVLMQNPGNPTVPITLNPVVGASIMLVDPSTGYLSSAGVFTDNLGHASLVFNTPGVYHISAIGETMNYIWGEEVTCGLAYCKVKVIEAGSIEQPLLSGLTVSNLNAEGLSFDPATFTYNVTTAATSTASVALTASFDEASYYLTADSLATGLIPLTSGGAGVFSTNVGINTVTLRLTDKQDIYNYSEYTVSILRPRVATLSALTLDTVNQPAINGRESGTLWKAGSSASELGTRSFAAATKDYRAFYLSEITSTGISKATPSLASSWLRISVNGSVVFTGQDFGNCPIAIDSNTTSVKIEVCTDATFQEVGGFIAEDTYRVSVELIPLTSQEIEDIKLQSLEVTGGELL
ncbi:MAG: hypothetical protein LBG68_04140, partial [Coriobacteriales bacterium]|nr:hypothetical protein [Coriobacteriales bacterium]